MFNSVHVLAEGYSRDDSSAPDCMRANCSCSLVQTRNGVNIIVDTMTAWDGEVIVAALAKLGVRCEDINYVVCTHGHSDHIGCNYLFREAVWHFVGACKSHGDQYAQINFDDAIVLDQDNVSLLATPGHTATCISLVVANAQICSGGTVGIVGDLFEREEDVWDSAIWLDAGSEHPKNQRLYRHKLAELCSYIIPGHGKGFHVTNEMREKLKLDMSES